MILFSLFYSQSCSLQKEICVTPTIVGSAISINITFAAITGYIAFGYGGTGMNGANMVIISKNTTGYNAESYMSKSETTPSKIANLWTVKSSTANQLTITGRDPKFPTTSATVIWARGSISGGIIQQHLAGNYGDFTMTPSKSSLVPSAPPALPTGIPGLEAVPLPNELPKPKQFCSGKSEICISPLITNSLVSLTVKFQALKPLEYMALGFGGKGMVNQDITAFYLNGANYSKSEYYSKATGTPLQKPSKWEIMNQFIKGTNVTILLTRDYSIDDKNYNDFPTSKSEFIYAKGLIQNKLLQKHGKIVGSFNVEVDGASTALKKKRVTIDSPQGENTKTPEDLYPNLLKSNSSLPPILFYILFTLFY